MLYNKIVQLIWLQNLLCKRQNIRETLWVVDFVKFCGLLRKPELWLKIKQHVKTMRSVKIFSGYLAFRIQKVICIWKKISLRIVWNWVTKYLKFSFFEKAKKICTIFLMVLLSVQTMRKIAKYFWPSQIIWILKVKQCHSPLSD